MKAIFATIACAMLVAVAAPAAGETIDDAIRTRLAPSLPADLGVATVHVPASLASAKPDVITVVAPSDPKPGRRSVKVTVGRKSVWVPVTFARLAPAVIARRALPAGTVVTEADVVLGMLPVAGSAPTAIATVVGGTITSDVAAGAAITDSSIAMPAPLPRGAKVSVVAVRGSVRVATTGTLETAARPGQPASVRLSTSRAVAHGTLVAPSTVVVGDLP
jgi:flagella basal body P-ring formation protein FlgA